MQRVIVVRHHDIDSAGFIADAFEARGAGLSAHLFPDGGPLPAFDGADHIVVLGAVSSVNDPDPWIAAELAWLRAADQAGVPVLGICFGAQALCAAFGGRIEAMGRREIGWTTVDSPDHDLVPAGPWLEFHDDRCLPPAAATVLARNDVAVQAFRISRHLAAGLGRGAPARHGPHQGVHEAVEAAVDADGHAEAAVGLQRDESVQGGPEDPDGVDGVVTVEAVAGHHRRYHRDEPVRDRLVVGVAGGPNALGDLVAARMVPRPGAPRVRHRDQGVVAGQADGGTAQRFAGLGHSLLGDELPEGVEALGVVPETELVSLYRRASALGQLGRRGHHPVRGQSSPRHERSLAAGRRA